jgi:hypothetical protein
MTLSVTDTQYNNALHYDQCYCAECRGLFTVMQCNQAKCRYAECRALFTVIECLYADCRYAECGGALNC